MAQNDNIECPPGEWTQITNGDVTALRAVVLRGGPVWLQATSSATAPSSADGAVPLDVGDILLPDIKLEDLFPGVSGAARVWVRPKRDFTTIVSVSHA